MHVWDLYSRWTILKLLQTKSVCTLWSTFQQKYPETKKLKAALVQSITDLSWLYVMYFLGKWRWTSQAARALLTYWCRDKMAPFRRRYFQIIFLNENVRISIKISLKFVPKVHINNNRPLVQIMAWRRPGDKPLSEPMMESLLTQICVTRPQWLKHAFDDGVLLCCAESTRSYLRLSGYIWLR